MGRFKVGDRVKEKDNFFGMGDKVGVVVGVDTIGFLSYSVRHEGYIELWEYHKGDLKRCKNE